MKLSNLLLKYHTKGPRYGIYPSVRDWQNNIDEQSWPSELKKNYCEKEGLDLYIHIPFCEQLCTFCGLNIKVTKDKSVAKKYIACLLKEWKKILKIIPAPKINNLYLGGGSPNFLAPPELSYLLENILKDSSQIGCGTIECDPRHFTQEHFSITERFGLNRYSLGIQDFSNIVTDNINRHQSFEQICHLSKLIKSQKKNILSYDFIYGLPLQKTQTFAENLAPIKILAPDLVIFYPLIKVPWLKNAQDAYGDFTLPPPNEINQLYINAKSFLENLGYQNIGFGHFAQNGSELYDAFTQRTLTRNIMGYFPKASKQFLGLGASAISFSGTSFKQNEKILDKYQRKVSQNQWAFFRGHRPSQVEERFRILLSQLVANRPIMLEDIERLLGSSCWKDRYQNLCQLQDDGLLRLSKKSLTVTELGRSFLKNICLTLDPRYSQEPWPSRH